MNNEMKDAIFWKPGFIPVYFIVALLHFLFFYFYIRTDNFSIYLWTIFLIALGIASINYNTNRKN